MQVREVAKQNENLQANKKQLWLIHLLQVKLRFQKTDFRNDNLTRIEASQLIDRLNKQLNASDNNKKPVNKTISQKDKFLQYISENMESIAKNARKSLNLVSEVREDLNYMRGTGKNNTAKTYTFIGFGCAFVWLTFDKRSKKAKQIYELARAVHMKEVYDMFLEYFSPQEIKSLSAKGCPLSALWFQDCNMQIAYYGVVAEYMRKEGVKRVDVDYRYD